MIMRMAWILFQFQIRETLSDVNGPVSVQRSFNMRFRYAQQRVRQLKGNIQPTESSVVIDWPTADQRSKVEDALPLSNDLKFKQVQPGRSEQIEPQLRKCE